VLHILGRHHIEEAHMTGAATPNPAGALTYPASGTGSPMPIA